MGYTLWRFAQGGSSRAPIVVARIKLISLSILPYNVLTIISSNLALLYPFIDSRKRFKIDRVCR